MFLEWIGFSRLFSGFRLENIPSTLIHELNPRKKAEILRLLPCFYYF
jgi:hypothetical protein